MVSKVPLVITKNIRGEVTFMWAFCVTFNQQIQTLRLLRLCSNSVPDSFSWRHVKKLWKKSSKVSVRFLDFFCDKLKVILCLRTLIVPL